MTFNARTVKIISPLPVLVLCTSNKNSPATAKCKDDLPMMIRRTRGASSGPGIGDGVSDLPRCRRGRTAGLDVGTVAEELGRRVEGRTDGWMNGSMDGEMDRS